MVLSFKEMEERDRRLALGPDGRDEIEQSACPCGKPVVEASVVRDFIGGRNNLRMRYYHSRYSYCEFVRRF